MILASLKELQGPDYFILVFYFLLMIIIGIYFYRFMKGTKDYFSGGNCIPWWLSGVSYFMSYGSFQLPAVCISRGLSGISLWGSSLLH